MKHFATYLLMAGASASQVKITKTEVVEIIGGIVLGAIKAEFGDIATCITDSEHVYNDFETAVKDFEEGSASGVLSGLKEIAHSFKDIKTALTDCKAISIKDDLQKLEAMAEIFSSPTSFIYHVGKDLIVNHAQIYDDVKDAVDSYHGQKWFQFGEDLGDAAAKVLIGGDNLGVTPKEKELSEGFLAGVFDVEHLENLKKCMKGEIALGKDLLDAIEDIKTLNVYRIIFGLEKIGDAFEAAVEAQEPCDNDQDDIKKLKDALLRFKNPSELIVKALNDIKIHGVQIGAEVALAVEDYESQDYFAAGKNMGAMFGQTFVGSVHKPELFLY